MIKSKKPLKLIATPKRSVSSEASEQSVFFAWLAVYRPFVRALTFAVPNGGKRNIFEAKALKLQGVTPGVPDVFMAIPSESFSGLFIEFKFGKNRASGLQNAFIARVREAGYRADICYSFEEAKAVVLEHLKDTEYE